MDKTVFKLVKGKHNFFSFSSNLAFKIIKDDVTPSRRLRFFAHFRITVKIC